MRKVITALCVLASVELTSDAVAQQWSEYRPADARFRVEMPGTPEIRSDTIPELGSLKLTQAVVESADGWFAASYVDLPPDQIKNASANNILDTARDTTIKWLVSRNNKSQLRSERRLITNGYPARHVVAEVPIFESVFSNPLPIPFTARNWASSTVIPSGSEPSSTSSPTVSSIR